jgi:hypothetical protein
MLEDKIQTAITLLQIGSARGEMIKLTKCVTPAMRPPARATVITIRKNGLLILCRLAKMQMRRISAPSMAMIRGMKISMVSDVGMSAICQIERITTAAIATVTVMLAQIFKLRVFILPLFA